MKVSKNHTLRVAICGDQNSKKSEIGYATSDWIARKTGLKVHRGPDAKHGTIDHVITDALVGDHIVVPGGGSDHASRIIELIDPLGIDDKVTVCYWNVERDRKPVSISEMLVHLTFLKNHKLKPNVFCLQEVKQYHNELSEWAKRNKFLLFVYKEPAGAWHNCILVREGVDVKFPRAKQTSKGGWVTSVGSDHTPVVATMARVAGWLLVASVHETVGVDWRKGKRAMPRGPVRRVAARVTSARTWVSIIKRTHKRRRA